MKVLQTKRTAYALLLFIAGWLASCSDSNENPDLPEPPQYPVTHFSKVELTTVEKESGTPDITVIQTYRYHAGRLTDFTVEQHYSIENKSFKMENSTQVTYTDHQAVVTDENNNVTTYTLNDEGYATECVRREASGRVRSYTFDYLVNTEGKHFLKEITESLEEGKIYATVQIEYNGYRTLRITQQVDGQENTLIATTASDSETANASEIPFRFLTELYPLSLHEEAIYGKFLGDAYETLITQLKPEQSGTSNETTTYSYTLDQRGIVTSCQESTRSYGTSHARTVDYTIE